MRHFTLDAGTDRKFVVIELLGVTMRVVQGNSEGITRRTEKALANEAQARLAADRMAGELAARGYVEQVSDLATATPPRPMIVARGAAVVTPVRPARATAVARVAETAGGLDLDTLSEAAEGDSAEAATLLPRMTGLPGAGATTEAAPRPKKKKPNAKKKQKITPGGDVLDKRVIALFIAMGIACVSFVGYLGYDTFLKPPTIIGHWEGSRLEHEKGKFLTHTEYQLILDGSHNATMTVEKNTSAGTYVLKGNQLVMTFKDDDGEVSETAYKVLLGRSTLELYEPSSNAKVVELIRFHAKSAAIAATRTKPAEAPQALGAAPANPADDAKLVSVDFLSKDGAFRLKRPVSWEVESGSRPDNTYSWARFTRDSGKLQVFADIAGSLMTGSNQSQHEEGSELAPVHSAHELYAKKAAEEYTDYVESKPTLIKIAGLGEGRIASFTASGGLFGSKIQGFRATFLTNDRRVSVLAEAPSSQFNKFQPTLLALTRSLAR